MKKNRIVLIFILSFIFIFNVEATSFSDVSNIGDKIETKKDVDGSSFNIGNTVKVNNNSNGINFTLGNIAEVSGKSDYSFIVGNEVNIKDADFKDGFIAGNIVNIESNIKRDSYIAGNIINLDGKIGRNVYITGSEVTINGEIEGNVSIAAEKITVKNAKINGTLNYNDDARISISKNSSISKSKTYESNKNEKSFVNKIFSVFELYTNLLLLGIILMLMFKKMFDKIEKLEVNFESIVKHFSIGFLFLIAVPIISLILISTMLGVGIGLILLAIYFIIMYMSSIFSCYYIFNKLLNKKIENKYTILIVGLVIIYALRLVPVISGIVQPVFLLVGIGIICNLISDFIKSNK